MHHVRYQHPTSGDWLTAKFDTKNAANIFIDAYEGHCDYHGEISAR